MELSEPRQKRCRLEPNLPLPVILKKDNSISKIKGMFNGFSVIVENREDMKNIISMGYFGKANLSRSYPQFIQDDRVEIIRQRQYDQRKALNEASSSKKMKKVIVVPNSDDEQDEYFTNMKPIYEIDRSGTQETVWLSPQEAFFLNQVVKCLDISYENHLLSPDRSWEIFSKCNKYFQLDYVAFYHFRAKNWVVKPGIKFGGDYLLYKQGPPFYHATYVVIIDVLNHNLQRIQSLARRSLDNLSVHGLHRLCETAGKELLMLQVILPKEFEENFSFSYEDIGSIQVKEVLMKRWIANQENN